MMKRENRQKKSSQTTQTQGRKNSTRPRRLDRVSIEWCTKSTWSSPKDVLKKAQLGLCTRPTGIKGTREGLTRYRMGI